MTSGFRVAQIAVVVPRTLSSAAAASARGSRLTRIDDLQLPTDMPSLDLVGWFQLRTPIVAACPSLPVTGSVEIVGDAGLSPHFSPASHSSLRWAISKAGGLLLRLPVRTEAFGVRAALQARRGPPVVPLHLILRVGSYGSWHPDWRPCRSPRSRFTATRRRSRTIRNNVGRPQPTLPRPEVKGRRTIAASRAGSPPRRCRRSAVTSRGTTDRLTTRSATSLCDHGVSP